MSKQEATRLADARASAVPLHELLASVPHDARLVIDDADGMGTRFIPVGRMAHEAAALLRQWPDGKPVAWQAQVFNVRHLTGEVRLRGIDGAEVPQDFVESGTIVEVRAVGTAPPDSAARIAELEDALKVAGEALDYTSHRLQVEIDIGSRRPDQWVMAVPDDQEGFWTCAAKVQL